MNLTKNPTRTFDARLLSCAECFWSPKFWSQELIGHAFGRFKHEFLQNSYSRVSVLSWSTGAVCIWGQCETATPQLEYEGKNFESIKSPVKPAWQFCMYLFCIEMQIYHSKNASIFSWIEIPLYFLSELQMLFFIIHHTHTCFCLTFSASMCIKKISSWKHLLQVCSVTLKACAIWTVCYNPGLASLSADAH